MPKNNKKKGFRIKNGAKNNYKRDKFDCMLRQTNCCFFFKIQIDEFIIIQFDVLTRFQAIKLYVLTKSQKNKGIAKINLKCL